MNNCIKIACTHCVEEAVFLNQTGKIPEAKFAERLSRSDVPAFIEKHQSHMEHIRILTRLQAEDYEIFRPETSK